MSKENRILAAMFISMALGYMPWYNFSAVLKYHFAGIPSDIDRYRPDPFCLSGRLCRYSHVHRMAGRSYQPEKDSLLGHFAYGNLLSPVHMGLSGQIEYPRYEADRRALSRRYICPGDDAPFALVSREQEGNRSRGLHFCPGCRLCRRISYRQPPLSSLWMEVRHPVDIDSSDCRCICDPFFVEDKPLEEAAVCKVSPQTGVVPSSAQCCPAGGYAGPCLITTGYVGHMWELYAFWGWIGPFLIATQLASGVPTAQAVSTGGTLTAAIILLGVPASWLWGWMADKRGRTFAMAVGGTLSVVGEFFLGSLFGYSFAFVVIVAGWIGFWVISDSALYKAGLLEMMDPKFTGLALGIQSAVGFGITIISPAVFGAVLQLYNGAGNPTSATQWWPSFGVLGVGGLLAPIAILLLRRMPQAVLMAGGKK